MIFKPGFPVMFKLTETLKLSQRPPPHDDLAYAFVDLFRSQYNGVGGYLVLEDVQLGPAVVTFRYLRDTYKEAPGFGIKDEDLRIALRVLRVGGSAVHIEMATLVFEELQRRREASSEKGEETPQLYADLEPYIFVLCRNGDALVARDLVEKHWQADLQPSKDQKSGSAQKIRTLWHHVLRGLTRARQMEEVEKTLEIMQRYGVPFDGTTHQMIVDTHAYHQKDMEMTKKWYYHPIANSRLPTTTTDLVVLKLCIEKNELKWGEPIFKKMMERKSHDKKSWHMILLWAAAKGRGVDEIDDMMKVMAKKTEGAPQDQPDMGTINELIAFANEKDDSYTAERYYALGQKWGFHPNAQTFILQLEYRIKVNDLSGAMIAYKQLQGESLEDNEDVPHVNKLIVAFCGQPTLRYETIMSLVEDLTERKAPFSPPTIAALSSLHFARNEMQDLADLVNTHAFHYSREQRMVIHDILLAKVLDLETPEVQAWETYKLLRNSFSDGLNRDIRVEVMKAFFTRRRPDMAVLIFGHMRQQFDLALRPDVDTYCAALLGLAQVGTLEMVLKVHNLLKIDTAIEPTTKLYNALMLAYQGIAEWYKAFQFWDTIIHTREGPSYSSIQIALQVCEHLTGGDKQANIIWQKLKRHDIEITREIYAAYIAALASRGAKGVEDGFALLDQCEQECGCKVDALL